MQIVLDSYLVGYNTKRPHQGRGMNGRTPAVAFTEGLPKSTLGSGLIDQSQKMTVAAMQMAEKKVWAHLS